MDDGPRHAHETTASRWGDDDAARRRAWLRLSYRERLRWLGQAKDFAWRAGAAARARRGRSG